MLNYDSVIRAKATFQIHFNCDSVTVVTNPTAAILEPSASTSAACHKVNEAEFFSFDEGKVQKNVVAVRKKIQDKYRTRGANIPQRNLFSF